MKYIKLFSYIKIYMYIYILDCDKVLKYMSKYQIIKVREVNYDPINRTFQLFQEILLFLVKYILQ